LQNVTLTQSDVNKSPAQTFRRSRGRFICSSFPILSPSCDLCRSWCVLAECRLSGSLLRPVSSSFASALCAGCLCSIGHQSPGKDRDRTRSYRIFQEAGLPPSHGVSRYSGVIYFTAWMYDLLCSLRPKFSSNFFEPWASSLRCAKTSKRVAASKTVSLSLVGAWSRKPVT